MSESLDEAHRNHDEAKTLYELLQDQKVNPMYYRRGEMGYSPDWMRMAKRSIATLLPRFSSTRMVGEYLAKFYLPATRQGRRYTESEAAAAHKVAAWKAHVRKSWEAVRLRRLDTPLRNLGYGQARRLEVAVYLDGLKPADVVVELLIGRQTSSRSCARTVATASSRKAP